MSQTRLTVLFNRIGPYHHARLRAASSAFGVTAVEYSNTDSIYAWDEIEGTDGFDRVTLFKDCLIESLPVRQVTLAVRNALFKAQPQAVLIPGWAACASLAALGWCLSQRVPAIAMSETAAWDAPRKLQREWVKRQLVSGFRAGLVGGTLQRDYLAALGIPRTSTFLGYDAVDNHYFAKQAEEARARSSEIGSSYGLPPRYFLASARFIEKKNLPKLLEAYARYKILTRRKDQEAGKEAWNLVLLGDGPLRPALRSRLHALDLHGCVHLPGFIQYPELPIYYGLASAFVHASRTEPWGLVVNEAMASGLPVLVSNRCGCANDLVQDGRNGFVFDPDNGEQLAHLMLRVASMEEGPRSQMGAVSRETIAKWGPDRFARGLIAATECALASKPRKASPLDHLLLHLLALRKG
jgi:1,2-diacylglycerol 3-alpha-glucosyltransferase